MRSETDIDDLRQMWADGVAIDTIAEALGWGRATVQRHAVRLKLGRHPMDCGNRHRMTDAVKARIVELRGNGFTLAEISKQVGFSISSVSEFVKPVEKRRPFRIEKRKRSADETIRIEVPGPVLADRERRFQLAPRDITAALLGDPLPGYSALEQRA